MSNVVPLFKEPHGTGWARCISCKHEWVAVAPAGELAFDCPNCGREAGHWRGEFAPAIGALMRFCGCGNTLFYLTPEGHLCPKCGILQDYS